MAARFLGLATSMALLLPGCSPMQSQQHSSGPANGQVWHLHEVFHGEQYKNFETGAIDNVKAVKLLVPAGWTFAARPSFLPDHKMDCNYTAGRWDYQAASADKGTGLIVIGGFVSMWATNPAALQQMRQYYQGHTAQNCRLEPPKPMAEGLAAAVPKLVPGSQVIGSLQPIPGLTEHLPVVLAQVNQQLAQQAAQSRTPPSHISAEAGRLRISGKGPDGKPNEAWLVSITTVRSDPAPGGGYVQTVDVPLLAIMYAPAGQLDSNEKLLTAILDSTRIDPEATAYNMHMRASILEDNARTEHNIAIMNQQTQQKIAQIHQEMAQDNSNTLMRNAGTQRDSQQYAAQVHANVTAERAAAFDHGAQQFSLHMGDQAIYKDPSTGQNVQLSNQYAHAWASTTGNTNEYILTDSASYNPNGQAGRSGWTQLKELR